MINIINNVDCCGCQACGDICVKQAISFQTDEEGIWYPLVNKEKCIDCGLCEKVCPILNNTSCPTNAQTPECFVLQAPDSYDRLQSASGAAYTLLVRAVFSKGGFVAGHIWDNQFGVKAYLSGNPNDLEILRGTKYLQSNAEGIYLKVKTLLNEGKFVLFSGTPCQNAALRSYLHNDYDNLVLTDFVCMGIDSPFAFKKYIESLESQYNSKIVYFKAKSKEVGWRNLTNKAVFENGKTYFGINGKDANLKATFLNILVRPSCYDCRFKGFPRVSDITIGDYWRSKYDYDPLDDNTGTSYIMIHNKKAYSLFNDIKDKCIFRKIAFDSIISANQKAVSSISRPFFEREDFYKKLHYSDFSTLVNDYYSLKIANQPFLSKVKRKLRLLIDVLSFYKSSPLSLFVFIYYNFFCSKVKTSFAKGDILLLKNTRLSLSKNSYIQVNGTCVIDANSSLSKIILGRDATLVLDTNVIREDSSILLENSATLNIGYKTIINKGITIHSQTNITIGDFSYIGDSVIIDDTNNGIVFFNEHNAIDKSITIGTHVLLSRGSIVKSGTTIGDECIVQENSIVKGVFIRQSVITGNPAYVKAKDLNWNYSFENKWNYKN